jgi:SAM-dependent methyltransferase
MSSQSGSGPASERLLKGLNKPYEELELRPSTGLKRRLRIAHRKFESLVYERGVETAGFSAGIEHFHPDRVTYQPSGWRFLHRILRRSDVRPDDVFVDIGSGKGRVLLQAAGYPFKRVVGVEVDAELNKVAEANLEARRSRRRCGEVELIAVDGAEWAIPDDVTVFYIYYPFGGESFRAVIRNLVASLEAAPRRILVIYALPVLEDVLMDTGRFHKVRGSRGLLGERLSMYESN